MKVGRGVYWREGGDRDTWFEGLYGGARWGTAGDPKTSTDEREATARRASLLYGEVLPEGVEKLFDRSHLAADEARTLVDLGAGLGRLALQAFLEHPSLQSVYAVELAKGRWRLGVEALERLAERHPRLFEFTADGSDAVVLKSVKDGRQLRFVKGDLFDTPVDVLAAADLVVCETRIPDDRQVDFASFLSRLRPDTRLMLYHSLESLPRIRLVATDRAEIDSTTQAERIAPHDSFLAASWSPKGHRFHMWRITGRTAGCYLPLILRLPSGHHAPTSLPLPGILRLPPPPGGTQTIGGTALVPMSPMVPIMPTVGGSLVARGAAPLYLPRPPRRLPPLTLSRTPPIQTIQLRPIRTTGPPGTRTPPTSP